MVDPRSGNFRTSITGCRGRDQRNVSRCVVCCREQVLRVQPVITGSSHQDAAGVVMYPRQTRPRDCTGLSVCPTRLETDVSCLERHEVTTVLELQWFQARQAFTQFPPPTSLVKTSPSPWMSPTPLMCHPVLTCHRPPTDVTPPGVHGGGGSEVLRQYSQVVFWFSRYPLRRHTPCLEQTAYISVGIASSFSPTFFCP